MRKNTNHITSKPEDIKRFRRRVLQNNHPYSLGPFRRACVFLLLYKKGDSLHIPAILKAKSEGYAWSDQVALPGGLMESGDPSPLDAAYRELEEELSITRPHVEDFGSIGHFQTLKNTEIQVFTGVWDSVETIRHDTSEIARIIDIPLDTLLDTHFSQGLSGHEPGWDRLLYPVEDVVIWGVTAKILHYFIELVYSSE